MRRNFTKVKGDVEAVWNEKYHLWLRPGTDDLAVAKGMNSHVKIDIQHHDTILELGGNIGAFTCWALRKGAACVIAVEADPDNFGMWMKNIISNDFTPLQAKCFPVAVTGRPDAKRVTLYRTTEGGKGRHSIIPHKTYMPMAVPAMSINQIFDECAHLAHMPSLIKCDIEGAEFEVFGVANIQGEEPIKLPATVRGIAIEYHIGKKGVLTPAITLEYAKRVEAVILAAGFHTIVAPKFRLESWGTKGYYGR